MNKIRFAILFILSILFFGNCTDDQCNVDTESSLRFELLVKDATLKTLKYLDSLAIYSPQWTDSIFYKDEGVTKTKSLFLMLSPYSDTSELIFTSNTVPLNDTIIIYSQRENIYLSPECGFITNFLIDTVLFTNNYIDSIEIVTSKITTEENGHIQVYF